MSDYENEIFDWAQDFYNKCRCGSFGHKYILFQKMKYDCDVVRCKKCGNYYVVNNRLKEVLPLDRELLDAIT